MRKRQITSEISLSIVARVLLLRFERNRSLQSAERFSGECP
jgi:hypothetical protein